MAWPPNRPRWSPQRTFALLQTTDLLVFFLCVIAISMSISKLHGVRTAVHMVEPAWPRSPPPSNNSDNLANDDPVPDDDSLASAARYIKSSVESIWNALNNDADTMPAEFRNVLAKCHSAEDLFENGLDAAETLLREGALEVFFNRFSLMILVQITSHYLLAKGELTLESNCETYQA